MAVQCGVVDYPDHAEGRGAVVPAVRLRLEPVGEARELPDLHVPDDPPARDTRRELLSLGRPGEGDVPRRAALLGNDGPSADVGTVDRIRARNERLAPSPPPPQAEAVPHFTLGTDAFRTSRSAST